jgi:hypothetical protein
VVYKDSQTRTFLKAPMGEIAGILSYKHTFLNGDELLVSMCSCKGVRGAAHVSVSWHWHCKSRQDVVAAHPLAYCSENFRMISRLLLSFAASNSAHVHQVVRPTV